MPAEDRAHLSADWSARRGHSSFLLATCHRVEIYGSGAELAQLARGAPAHVRWIDGVDAARHLVRVAVGRDSAVVAEDQILHQLRVAAHSARQAGALPRDLDRALDMALRAGRSARSWLPARRPTLVDLALSRALRDTDPRGRPFHVVGTGEMGRGAIAHLLGRGANVTVSSRTIESARNVGERFGIGHTTFDPGPALLSGVDGVVVALNGRWSIDDASRQGLLASAAWISDLSSPPALDREFSEALDGRLSTIDDLATAADEPSGRLLVRLDALVERTVAEYERWVADENRRAAAEALALRAQAVQAAELDRLWRRVPTLDDAERAEVTRAVDQLTQRLLRDPLEQLGNDGDGSHARAARELFRL
jgi:glutamyl-tRNA reductase